MDEGKFKVRDLVRLKPLQSVPEEYRLTLGHIVDIFPNALHPYAVSIDGQVHFFAEDELEKI